MRTADYAYLNSPWQEFRLKKSYGKFIPIIYSVGSPWRQYVFPSP